METFKLIIQMHGKNLILRISGAEKVKQEGFTNEKLSMSFSLFSENLF